MGGSCGKPKQGQTNKDRPGRKQGHYSAQETSDTQNCNITGLAITKDGHILMVDENNQKVKLFNEHMKFLSSIQAPGAWDIGYLEGSEAAVGSDNCIMILNVSDGKLSVKKKIEISADLYGISKCGDKFLATFPNEDPACIKLIDQSGKETWTLSSGQNEQPLFISPWYATVMDEDDSNVIVTDRHTNTLTVVNGETGDIVTRHQAERKGPFGVYTDTEGHVYVCYWDSREVAILSRDLAEETILLSKKNGLGEKPQAIIYDAANKQIVVSYFICNHVDSFQLK